MCDFLQPFTTFMRNSTEINLSNDDNLKINN